MADREEQKTAQNGGDTGTGDDDRPDYYTKDRPKAEDLIHRYELDGILEEIQRQWESEDDDRWSIRECGAFFNTQIIESVFRNQIYDEPNNYSSRQVYELLDTDEDNLDHEDVEKRDDLRNWFQNHGVDPDELASDFIHYRTLYKYLKERQEASSPQRDLSPQERRERALKSIQKSKNRYKASVQKEIQRAQNAGALPATDVTFETNDKVQCPECDRLMNLQDYLTEGCNCGPADT